MAGEGNNKTKGLTIPEVLIVIALGMFLVGVILSMWYFAYRNWTAERIETSLKINLEIATEEIREGLELSSLGYMSFYSSDGKSPYTAISFPVAVPDEDDPDFYKRGIDTGLIYWDRSCIYFLHEYTNDEGETKHELRKTVFDNNHDILVDDVLRYEQLESVVENGGGASLEPVGSESCIQDRTVLPLFEEYKARQDVNFIVEPKGLAEFNCYSETKERANLNFGNFNFDPDYDSGYHELKFEVIGKQMEPEESEGYKINIDTFSITPSGCVREPEVYIDHSNLLGTIYATGGDTAAKVGPDSDWSGRRYLEYEATAGIGDYITFRLYYDLWRDSNFRNPQETDNLVLVTVSDEEAEDDLYMRLCSPEENSEMAWQAKVEIGSDRTDYDYPEGHEDEGEPIPLVNDGSRPDITVRNVISEELEISGDLVRVWFDSHLPDPNDPDSDYPLRITSAYLDKRDGETTPDCSTEKATHVQLFFTTDADGNIILPEDIPGAAETHITPGATIPAGSSGPSNWAIYPFNPAGSTDDYLVTFYVDDMATSYVSYWPGTTDDTRSYLICDGDEEDNYASHAIWSDLVLESKTGLDVVPPDELPEKPPEGEDPKVTASRHIYAISKLEAWSKEGIITSGVYDTEVAAPDYQQMVWTQNLPDNSAIAVEARSSDDPEMAGASSWNTDIGAIGTGRYVQYRATLEKDPLYWVCATKTCSKYYSAKHLTRDEDYKEGSRHIRCPTCKQYLAPRVSIPDRDGALALDDYFPRIDNVTLSWAPVPSGQTRSCEVSGYFIKDVDAGIITLTVDGQAPERNLQFEITISEDFQNEPKPRKALLRTVVEPKNTGK